MGDAPAPGAGAGATSLRLPVVSVITGPAFPTPINVALGPVKGPTHCPREGL